MHEPKFENVRMYDTCDKHNTTQHNEPKLNTNDFGFGGSHF